MKLIRLDLLTLLISLFILGSCKNQNEIGLPVGSQQLDGTLLVYNDITVKTDTDNVTVTSRTPNSTSNLSPAKTPLSSLVDSRLGETTSNIAAGLNLPGSYTYTVPTGTITTDSVVLELRYAQGFYGDSLNTKFKINVYQLNERPLSSQNYYSNKHWDHATQSWVNPAKAGAFNARPNTPVKITDIVTGAADTQRVAAPQLRVSLIPSKITDVLFNNSSAVASNTAFQNAIKGLYLTLERSQSSQVGATLMFNLDSSKVNVYYRVDNDGDIDTAVASLPIATHAAEITHTYTAEVNAAMAGTASNDIFYIQGLTGLRAKIGFPNIKTIFGTNDLKTIAINRAELIVAPEPGTELPPFTPQPQLTLYRLDITKQRTYVPDANGSSTTAGDPRFFGSTVFGGNYISARKEYHFVVTGYMQDLINGKLVDYGTYIGAIDTLNRLSSVDIGPSYQAPGRLVATGTKSGSPYRIKLNVIYTKNN